MQFAAILWLMLDFPWLIWPTAAAGAYKVISGSLNLADGVRQVKAAE